MQYCFVPDEYSLGYVLVVPVGTQDRGRCGTGPEIRARKTRCCNVGTRTGEGSISAGGRFEVTLNLSDLCVYQGLLR